METLWQLDSFKTRDGLKLYGILSEPEVFDLARTAVILIHGLTGAFYHGLARAEALQALCQHAGYALAAYNNRGHDVVLPRLFENKKGIESFGGSGFEKFEDCVYDIDGVIAHLKKKGYRKFVLVGHSTGANKVAYYLSQHRSASHIVGGILLSPISDIAGEVSMHKSDYESMRKKVSRMKPGELIVSELGPFVMSPARFKSLYEPGSSEDIFPYYDEKADWKLFSKIETPLLVCVGAKDEWLDRPTKQYFEGFVAHASGKAAIETRAIPSANHGYKKKEKFLAQILIQWIQNL
jgi:pimeloyl-ACP methyl ester carboxylesterase